jgi:hypothetical protein
VGTYIDLYDLKSDKRRNDKRRSDEATGNDGKRREAKKRNDGFRGKEAAVSGWR